MPNSNDTARHGTATRNSKVNIPIDLHQQARAAVRLVERVTGRRYTFAQFVREAFVAQLTVIARDYNSGCAIVPDTEPLEPGRR
jgi:hypothetical protein